MAEDAEEMHLPCYTEQIYGHGAAEHTFSDAFSSDRLQHAWLISGPRGIGKASLAWKFAKFLLTQGSGTDAGLFGEPEPAPSATLDVDPNNPEVKRIAAGGHGGLLVVERSINEKTGQLRADIVVQDIRRVNNFFAQTSAEGGWRVAIIDAADEMNANAANALLKILEEPPEKSILLLVAHAPGKLLPTIRSRCRTLKLNTLSEESVQAVLSARFPNLSDEEMLALARLSEGAPGRAVQMALEDGVGLYRQMGGLIADLPRLNVPAAHQLAVQLAAKNADARYRLFIQIFTAWLERLIRQLATQSAAQDILQGESAQIARISALAGVDRWIQLWEKVGQLVLRADAVNLDKKQVIISLLTGLAAVSRGQ